MVTLGIWLGPIIAAVIASVVIPVGLRVRFRRGREIERLATAIDRLAAQEASRMSSGYPEQYQAWHDYFTGRRRDSDGIVSPPSP